MSNTNTATNREQYVKENEERAKAEMVTALSELRKAWCRTVGAFSDAYIDCNDYIIDDYPFDQSFDEIDVVSWIDTTLEKMK